MHADYAPALQGRSVPVALLRDLLDNEGYADGALFGLLGHSESRRRLAIDT